MKRKITAIMAADVAEYTRLIAEDEEETLRRLESYRQVFDDFVKKAGGRIFNTAGDGVMCEFPSAVEATRAAIDIQESLRTRNLAYPQDRQMHFRIGLSIGDVVEREGDLLGDGVNVAARLQSIAEPGGICVSRNVHEAVLNKISVPFQDLGEREVKNLPHPVHAYRIEINARETGTRERRVAPRPVAAGAPAAVDARTIPASWIAAAILLVSVGGAGMYFALRSAQPPVEPQKQQVAVSEKPPEKPPETPDVSLPQGQSASVVVTENLTPAQAFEKLAKSGGIVKDAKTAPELYHNARSFEARGEAAAARRDYLALAALGTDHIDPLMRFAALLRAQDGRAGAREIFADLARDKGRAAGLVHILQFDGAERQSRLVAFAEANPDYAPVHALLAQEFGEDRQNAQTIDNRRKELAATRRFLAAEREGTLVSFFLDHGILAQWLERAQKRETVNAAFFAGDRDRISFQFQRSNAGWTGIVTPPEAATEIQYAIGKGAGFRTTRLLDMLDPRTGKRMPNPSFEMPGAQEAAEISIRYKDANGVLSAVTTIHFDPRAALIRGQRAILEQFSSSWIEFGKGHNAQFLYFTHLVSYRCAIQKAEIGFNGEAPHEALPMPPCDSANPHAIPSNVSPYLRVRPDVESASLRITFVGGETSEVKTYPRGR